MNRRRSLWHKVGYACAIVVLLLPLSYLSQPQTTESPRGQAGRQAGPATSTAPEPGRPGRNRSDQRSASSWSRWACAASAANIMWQKANEYKKTEDWMALLGGPGADHPPAAQLHQRLAVPGLEPVVQHLGRVRRLSRPLLLGDEGHQFHHRRHPVQRERAPTAVRRGLVHLAKNRPGRRAHAISQAVQAKTTILQRHASPATSRRRSRQLAGRARLVSRRPRTSSTSWACRSRESLRWCFIPIRRWRLINYTEAIEDDGTFGEVAKNAWRKSGRRRGRISAIATCPRRYNLTIHLNDHRAAAKEIARGRRRTRPARTRRFAKKSERRKSPPCPDEDREILGKPRNRAKPAKITRRSPPRAKSSRAFTKSPNGPTKPSGSRRCGWPRLPRRPRTRRRSSTATARSSISSTGAGSATWSRPPTRWQPAG